LGRFKLLTTAEDQLEVFILRACLETELVSKYRWRAPLPLSATCTVSTEAGVLVLPCHGLVRSGSA
jgi:hypothetical protein